MNNTNTTTPSKRSKESPSLDEMQSNNKATQRVAIQPSSTSTQNDDKCGTFETSNKEPSNREILSMLQTIKTDVDYIKTVIKVSSTATPSLDATNDAGTNVKQGSAVGVVESELSTSELVAITEQWDEANPKESRRCFSGKSKSRSKRSDRPQAANGDSISSCTRLPTVSTPPRSRSQNASNLHKNRSTVTGSPSLYTRMLERRAQLRSVNAPMEQSGATLVARRIAANADTTLTTAPGDESPFEWANTMFSGATDWGLMLLYHLVCRERRRRLEDATAANSQERIAILGGIIKNGSKPHDKMKKNGKK